MFLVGESVERVKRELCRVQIYEPLRDLNMRTTDYDLSAKKLYLLHSLIRWPHLIMHTVPILCSYRRLIAYTFKRTTRSPSVLSVL